MLILRESYVEKKIDCYKDAQEIWGWILQEANVEIHSSGRVWGRVSGTGAERTKMGKF